VRLTGLRRRTGAYDLSDALSAGIVGGMIGFAAGAALCVLGVEAARPVGGWRWALVGQFLPFAGLALLEGAAVGVAMAFVVARFSPGHGAKPPENSEQTRRG